MAVVELTQTIKLWLERLQDRRSKTSSNWVGFYSEEAIMLH